MDPVFKFVIEAACLVGVVLLAAVSTPALGGKRWDRLMWLRSTGVMVVGLVYLVVNPRGAPDLFPIVIGFTAFVIAIVALFAAITLAWRFTHRGRRTEVDRQAMVNFAGMGLFGLFAGASFIGAVICVAALVQGLGDQATYQHAPNCQTTSTSLCRSQTDGRVVRTWAESSRGRHWIEVSALGRNQTIEVTTATDVWLTLVRGSRVTVTSWKGHVAEVTVPGVGSMQTVDSPNYGLIAAIGLSVLSLAGLVIFSVWALIFWVKWRTASRGIDTSQIAA